MAGCGSGCVIAHLASDSACSPKVKPTMRSDTIVTFRIDPATATLAPTRPGQQDRQPGLHHLRRRLTDADAAGCGGATRFRIFTPASAVYRSAFTYTAVVNE